MRARYLIRDMANGDPKAWARAEAKVSQSDVMPENRQVLLDAMATMPDPRVRFSVTVHTSADWSAEPPAHASGFTFETREAATVEAFREMWRQFCAGAPRSQVGAYVTSNDSFRNGGVPSVEVLLTLP